MYIAGWVRLLFCMLLLAGCAGQTKKMHDPDVQREVVRRKVQILEKWQKFYVTDFPIVKFLPVTVPAQDEFMTAADLRGLLPTLPEQQRMEIERFLYQERQRDAINDIPASANVVFHNPRDACAGFDVLRCTGSKEQILDPSQQVSALVHYRWMKERFGTSKSFSTPPEMDAFLEEEVQRLIQSLPNACRELVDGYHLEIREPEQHERVLWVEVQRRTRARSGSIIFSPLFVRTVFMYTTTHPSSQPFEQLRGLLERRERTVNDVQAIVDRSLDRFATQMRFVIAHELAHVHQECATESDCDVTAFQHIRGHGGSVELGALKTVLGAAIEEGRPDLWGFDANSSSEVRAIQDRIVRLEELEKDSSQLGQLTCSSSP